MRALSCFVLMIAIASCVGDDPAVVQSSPTADSGADAAAAVTDGGTNDAATTPGDAGTDTSAADAGYRPTWLASSLAFWLDGDDVSSVTVDASTLVASWKDRSPNALTATAPAFAAKPTYVARNGVVPGAVRFNGSSNYLRVEDHSALQWGAQDFLIEIVARHGKGAAERCGLWNKASTSPADMGDMGLFANSQMGGGDGKLEGFLVGTNAVASPSGGFNNNLTFLLALERKNGVLALRVGGAEVATDSNAIQVAPIPGGAVLLGAAHDGASPGNARLFLQGDIAEIVAVKGPLAPEKRGELEAYLKAKHALP